MTRRADAPPFGLMGALALGLSAAFLAAGVLAPGAAEGLLRVYFPALALAFVLTRVEAVRLPRRMAHDDYSPFVHARTAQVAEEAPRVIRDRARELAALETSTSPVPASIRWLVIDELTLRLSERRGLSLADPKDWDAARALLSERTWALVRPPGSEGLPGSGGTRRDTDAPDPRLDHLASILDDLERL